MSRNIIHTVLKTFDIVIWLPFTILLLCTIFKDFQYFCIWRSHFVFTLLVYISLRYIASLLSVRMNQFKYDLGCCKCSLNWTWESQCWQSNHQQLPKCYTANLHQTILQPQAFLYLYFVEVSRAWSTSSFALHYTKLHHRKVSALSTARWIPLNKEIKILPLFSVMRTHS